MEGLNPIERQLFLKRLSLIAKIISVEDDDKVIVDITKHGFEKFATLRKYNDKFLLSVNSHVITIYEHTADANCFLNPRQPWYYQMHQIMSQIVKHKHDLKDHMIWICRLLVSSSSSPSIFTTDVMRRTEKKGEKNFSLKKIKWRVF